MSAPSSDLSRRALSLLLTIVNTPKMEMAVEGFTSPDTVNEIVAARLMSPVNSRQTTLWVDGVDRELLPNPNGPGYRYFSAGAGWVSVDAIAITRYQIDMRRFLGYLRCWLTISAHQPMNELSMSAVWDLGDVWVGRKRLAVLFVRRAHLPASVVSLRHVLSGFPRRRSAIVLTDVAISQQGPSLPGEPLCVSLMELILPDQVTITSIDKSLFEELLGHSQSYAFSKPPVWCSDDGSELIIYGEHYVFNGFTHKKIIRQLFDAWEGGAPRLRTQAVLEIAESHSKTFSQAFSGCTVNWKAVVGYEKGYCWLIV